MEELKNVVTLEKNAEKKIAQKRKIEEGAVNNKPKTQSLEEIKKAKEILDDARKAVVEKYPPDEPSEIQTPGETPAIPVIEKPKSKKNKLATSIVNFFTEDVGDAPMDMNYLDAEQPKIEKAKSVKKEKVITSPEQGNVAEVREPVLTEMSMFTVPDFVRKGFNKMGSKVSEFFNKKSAEKEIVMQETSGNITKPGTGKIREITTVDLDGLADIEDATAEVVETKVNSGNKKKRVKDEKKVIPTLEQRDENDINKSKKLLEERLGEKEKSIASIADLVLLAEDVYLNEDPELQKFALELWKSDKVIEEIGNGSKDMDDEKIKEVIDRISNVCGDKDLFIKEIKKLKEKSEENKTKNNIIMPDGWVEDQLFRKNPKIEQKSKTKEETKKPEVENTTQKPEGKKIVVENQDNNKVKGAGEVTPENVKEFLTPLNTRFSDKIPGRAMSIMSSLYKGINKIPVVNRLVAKVEIAYNQKWIDVKEEKSVNLKGKMDELDVEMKNFAEAKDGIRSMVEEFKKEGRPGYESLLLKIKRIEKQEAKMQNKKDTLQSRIESRENQIKLYTNKRDAIADRMIGKYNEKLSPIEAKLQENEGYRDRLNLFIAGKEAAHDAKIEYLKHLEGQKNKCVENYKKIKASNREIARDKTIKNLEKEIAFEMNKIKMEKETLAKEKERMNNKIAKIDEKANPYRDRKNEFIRVKENRPIKIDLKERTNLENNTVVEETSGHTRTNENASATGGSSYYDSGVDNSYPGSTHEFEISKSIPEYNKYIKQISKDEDAELLTIKKDLFDIVPKETQALTLEKLMEIIKKYYDMKKIPKEKYLPILEKLTNSK